MDAFTIILVRPQMPENIGAVARAMGNFGLKHLRLVSPRDGWPNPLAEPMATSALPILSQAAVYETLTEALQGIHQSYAITARSRAFTKPAFFLPSLPRDPDHLPPSTAFVFGPENNGLSNDEVSHTHAILSIPTEASCPSMNLAHAVAVLCYEVMRQKDVPPPASQANPATQAEVLAAAEHLTDVLEHHRYYTSPDKKPGMKLTLRNLFTNRPWLQQEIQTLRGVFRALDPDKKSKG
jgi:tRNA/rRNA methyltransferase